MNSNSRDVVTHVAEDQKTLCLKEMKSQKRNTQNSNFKEENCSRFYSWELQRTVVKKRLFNSVLPRLLFFNFFFFFCYYQTSRFPPRTSASVRRKGSPSSSWRWRLLYYLWPVDTFISVKLLTGWVWHGSGRRGPLLNLPGNLSWTAKISLLGFPYIVIWWINSKVPEGSMMTSENSSVARESSRVIILKSRLDSTGHSACTIEVRDIFDRQTHIPNDRWQLMCSRFLHPWDRRNSMTAPVRNITRTLSDK